MEENFKFYSKSEIKKILKQKERLVYVDDGIDEIIVKYKDLSELIVDASEKNGMRDLKVYAYPAQSMNPLLTTLGMFLDKCDPNVRKTLLKD